jgi:diguanylate cyclase (GGDEF)-like protein
VGRPDIASRTRNVLVSIAGGLSSPASRAVVFGGGVAVSVALHAALGDPRIAWLAAPIAVLAGLTGAIRPALAISLVAVVGHAGVDIVAGIGGAQIPGLIVRSLVLPGLVLVGAVGAHVEAQRQLAMQRAVNEDAVTGLLNARTFYAELAALRAEAIPFSVLLADIRGMRALNDRYGHPTGTEAMRAMAHVLRRAAGADVLASRLGSDEIAVALIGPDRDRCQEVVQQVMLRLHDELVSLPDGERFEIHAAYGIARFPEDGDDEITLLRAADKAKEQAKRDGLDHVAQAGGDLDHATQASDDLDHVTQASDDLEGVTHTSDGL